MGQGATGNIGVAWPGDVGGAVTDVGVVSAASVPDCDMLNEFSRGEDLSAEGKGLLVGGVNMADILELIRGVVGGERSEGVLLQE